MTLIVSSPKGMNCSSVVKKGISICKWTPTGNFEKSIEIYETQGHKTYINYINIAEWCTCVFFNIVKEDQVGLSKFCFTAEDSKGFSTERRCITLKVLALIFFN